MYTTIIFHIDKEDEEQIDVLARKTGRPNEFVLRDIIKAGLKKYQAPPTKGVKVLLDLAEWADKNNIRGPKDLSTHHNTYAWGE